MKRFAGILLLFALAVSLCACGGVQRTEKTGEKFPAALMESGTGLQSAIKTETTPIGWHEELTSDNGEVKINIHDESFDGIPEEMPVISVKPKTVSSDMVRRTAEAIFGDSPLYEYGWMLTHAEVEKRIAAWEEGVTTERIRQSHEEDLSDGAVENIRRTRQEILNYYREAWAYAPEELTPKECDWLFRPIEYWEEQGHDYGIEYPAYTDEIPVGVSAYIRAQGRLDGLDYVLWAHNLERDDFWNHSISVHLNEIGGMFQAETYEATGRLSAVVATDEQLRQAERNAEALIARTGLGAWRCEAHVREMQRLEDDGSWTGLGLFCIEMEGWKIRADQGKPIAGMNAELPDSGYGESFYMICANDGTLFDMRLSGLLEETVTENVPLISLDEAMEAARAAMAQWTLVNRVRFITEFDAPTGLTREITDVSVGHYRKPLGGHRYELIPVLCLHGAETVEGVPDYDYLNDREADFLLVDLRDGSVIQAPPAQVVVKK